MQNIRLSVSAKNKNCLHEMPAMDKMQQPIITHHSCEQILECDIILAGVQYNTSVPNLTADYTSSVSLSIKWVHCFYLLHLIVTEITEISSMISSVVSVIYSKGYEQWLSAIIAVIMICFALQLQVLFISVNMNFSIAVVPEQMWQLQLITLGTVILITIPVSNLKW